MIIMKATKDQARDMGSCHYFCWQETYRGLIDDAFLDNMNEEKNRTRFENNVWKYTGEYQYVMMEDDKIIGIFDISKARDNYAPYEVQGLYLRKVYQGNGYGREVMNFIKEKTNGHFYLWCLNTNPTCGYYEHMGGKVVDSKEEMIGSRKEIEVCYLWNEK